MGEYVAVQRWELSQQSLAFRVGVAHLLAAQSAKSLDIPMIIESLDPFAKPKRVYNGIPFENMGYKKG